MNSNELPPLKQATQLPGLVEKPFFSLGQHRLIGHLTAFYYAARSGSIQGGAKQLGINRNSLSRYLDELESVGGTRLRNPDSDIRGLDLTEAGRHLVRLLEPLFERMETVLAELGGGLQELRLGCQSSTSSYLLPGWMRAFEGHLEGTRSPDAAPLRFSLKTGSSEEILASLRGLEVDVGIIATGIERSQVEGGIQYTPLFRESLIAICPRSHPLLNEVPIPSQQFVRHPQYLYYRGGERYQEKINALAPGEGASRRMELDTIAAIKETVRAGLGISIIPGGAIREEDREWLAVAPLEVPPQRAHLLSRTLAVVVRAGDELTPLSREFLEFLRNHRKELI